jgi:hypothetical protein
MPALKGAFIKLDAGLLGFAPDIVVFQFNPETITRSPSMVTPPVPAEGSGARSTGDVPGEPSESISFSLRLDATDQLAATDPVAAANGILPALSALEILMYPGSSPASALSAGTDSAYENPPEKLPTVLFFWGPFRILPVYLTSLSINETEYDQLLNPIRAEVSVSLQVITLSQLPADALLARGAYSYTQGIKESMAALNLASPPDVLSKTLSNL